MSTPTMSPPPHTAQRLGRRALLAAAPFGLAGGGFTLLARPGGAAHAASPALRSLDRGGPWINSPEMGPDLRGRVVLVNFWTYTCINSLRPLPHLRAWATGYGARGLTVIGVHSPEFSFELEAPRVRAAVAEQGVEFPVVLDNAHRIWSAFGNSAWPGFYFLDVRGRLRAARLGEGDYGSAERLIRTLLAEAGAGALGAPVGPVQGRGVQLEADWDRLGSPETYVGYGRARGFASPGGLRRNEIADYRAPAGLALNRWALAGSWRVEQEAARGLAGARLSFRFQARDLHLVMAPAPDGSPVRFRIRLDGAAPGADHGVDVDGAGRGRIQAARMYQLVRQAAPERQRTFEIEFLDAGARAFAFTFG